MINSQRNVKIVTVIDMEIICDQEKVRIDKYTVHAALNHMDESMKVTDIYIERDFAIENNADAKVIDYVFNR